MYEQYNNLSNENLSKSVKINRFEEKRYKDLNRIKISELISELFSQIKSKESCNYISNLLITSIKEYEKFFINHDYSESENSCIEELNEIEISKLHLTCDSRSEYLGILNDIDSILSNCSELSNNQKMDFCVSQRHFMKLYLRQVVIDNNIT
ncbi:hypothetical protein LCGC14_1050210 [marine sediment metagenome]|uniref:Uncharacterized protein n=1 Tax=marine sediment metagenome TaxID=412755 RepID=A0A0F9QV26_9ZZZZ